MTVSAELELQSYVLLQLGEHRFAIPANQVAELVAPSRVSRFPHRSPGIEGVILRRGRIVPVCDVGESLIGDRVVSRRFYLIAVRHYKTQSEWVAIPVTGECELIHADLNPPGDSDASHVGGWLSHDGHVIQVLNLESLIPGPSTEYEDLPQPRFVGASR
jgi:chemotaxis signal transduction protein